MRDRLWLLGLVIGPLFAWLCWAVQRRKWPVASIALLVNVAFWLGGSLLIAELWGLTQAAS